MWCCSNILIVIFYNISYIAVFRERVMKKLKGLWKIIFGRTAILVFLMVIQAVILFGGFAVLDNKILIVNYGVGILAVIILMYVLNARQNSSY